MLHITSITTHGTIISIVIFNLNWLFLLIQNKNMGEPTPQQLYLHMTPQTHNLFHH